MNGIWKLVKKVMSINKDMLSIKTEVVVVDHRIIKNSRKHPKNSPDEGQSMISRCPRVLCKTDYHLGVKGL